MIVTVGVQVRVTANVQEAVKATVMVAAKMDAAGVAIEWQIIKEKISV